MLGHYVSFLHHEKGVGALATRDKPRIPAFSFVEKHFTETSGIGYHLDTLNWF